MDRRPVTSLLLIEDFLQVLRWIEFLYTSFVSYSIQTFSMKRKYPTIVLLKISFYGFFIDFLYMRTFYRSSMQRGPFTGLPYKKDLLQVFWRKNTFHRPMYLISSTDLLLTKIVFLGSSFKDLWEGDLLQLYYELKIFHKFSKNSSLKTQGHSNKKKNIPFTALLWT